MVAITRILKVAPDGTVVVPIGVDKAGEQVEVNVSPLVNHKSLDELTDQEWRERVLETAGSITDPAFYRHDQGVYEHRLEFE